MKKILFTLFFISSFSMAKTYNVDTLKSVLNWKGSKHVGDFHTGTIKFKSGTIELNKKGDLTKMNLVMDMKTINDTDLTSLKYKAKLENHLKSKDFFYVQAYPTATFISKTVKKLSDGKYEVTGSLKIRNKAHSKTITMKVMKKKSSLHAKVDTFIFDRTKYNVMYGSKGLMKKLHPINWLDKLINHDIEVRIDITAR